jgi:CheY-like chemotaxis protein
VSAEISSAGDAVIFEVTDTGIGIALEDQERIFNEFTQIDNPVQKHVKGTGLGLPLSRRLAMLLGGALTVESSVGVGSTFRLTLPASTIVRTDAAPAPGIARRLGPKSILIVDDEVASRYLAHRLFDGTRHNLIETRGAEAAERARFEDPALILLDLVMPDSSGFEVLEQLKSDETSRHIPVVIHTSKLLTEADTARLGDKIVAVLPKGAEGRLHALLAMREILGESNLFQSEPEFS